MNILALDTSTEACSVALQRADGEVFSRFEMTPRQHTRYLPVMLDEVMQRANIDRADLDYIAYANGPGAFTGVRIAAASAQGLALGLGIPLLAVSTLAVLAQGAVDRIGCASVVAALDARMGEAYHGCYTAADDDLVMLQGEEMLIPLGQLDLPEAWVGVGSAFVACADAGNAIDAPDRIYAEVYPDAVDLLKLAAHEARQGQAFSIARTRINYLRNRVAEKKKSPLPGF
jgi:tRNA threonylcarbamoyladenosine biosynthesis protein TsaB